MVGKLEPFSIVRGQFVRGRNLDRLTQARLERSFPGLLADLFVLAHGSYLLELFRSCVPYRQAARGPFRLLLLALEGLEGGIKPAIVCRWAEIHLLAGLGYAPQLDECVLCARSDRLTGFSPGAGGVLCAACAAERSLAMAPPVLACLRFLARSRLDGAARLRQPADQARRVRQILAAHFQEHWPSRPDPERMLRAWGCEEG